MVPLSLLSTGEFRVTRSMRRKGCPIGRDCGRCSFCHDEDVLRSLTNAKAWFVLARMSCRNIDKYKFLHGAIDWELLAIKKRAMHAGLMVGDKIIDRGLRKKYDRKKRELEEMARRIRTEERREARRRRREGRV